VVAAPATTFRAIDAGRSVDGAVAEMFAAGWPAYRSWYLSDGERSRPTYAVAAEHLRRYMPELVGTYQRLVDAVGGGDLQARFLSHWSPPPMLTACSLAAWNRDGAMLVRSYDYPPLLCDATALASQWSGTRVVAMSDCVWGAVDGINEHGLAVAIAFGGRPVVGEGFGIGLVVRYVLETAQDVQQALAVLSRVPVQLAYNVALVDRSGAAAIAMVAPDRPMALAPGLTAGNRQGVTEWPEHAAFCATVEREAALAQAAADPAATAASLVAAFSQPPLHRDPATTLWGTVYVAAYDTRAGALDLIWPDDTWRLTMDTFTEGVRTRRTRVAVPPPEYAAAPEPSELVPVRHGQLIA
jgi:predicted choloylglycine hydrolase